MCLPDDRTAKARIRDEALRLFGARGPDTVTVRDVANAAEVSPALVVRHYGNKDGLREAVDNHVTGVFETMLGELSPSEDAGVFDRTALPSLAEAVAGHLAADSPIPAYLARMLLAESPNGSALFNKLYAASKNALADLDAAGPVTAGPDPDVRAAFLLVNDLAVLMLRAHLHEVLGTDPLSAGGMRRWGAEVLAIYQHGLTDARGDRGV